MRQSILHTADVKEILRSHPMTYLDALASWNLEFFCRRVNNRVCSKESCHATLNSILFGPLVCDAFKRNKFSGHAIFDVVSVKFTFNRLFSNTMIFVLFIREKNQARTSDCADAILRLRAANCGRVLLSKEKNEALVLARQ